MQKVPFSPWPKPKLTGFALEGQRFENRIAKALPSALHNPWFRFADSNGLGYCSPDIIHSTRQAIFIIECKLTYTVEALYQLQKLYIPIITAWAPPDRSVVGVVVVKNLGRDFQGPKVHSNLREALPLGLAGVCPLILSPVLTPAHLKAQFFLPP